MPVFRDGSPKGTRIFWKKKCAEQMCFKSGVKDWESDKVWRRLYYLYTIFGLLCNRTNLEFSALPVKPMKADALGSVSSNMKVVGSVSRCCISFHCIKESDSLKFETLLFQLKLGLQGFNNIALNHTGVNVKLAAYSLHRLVDRRKRYSE